MIESYITEPIEYNGFTIKPGFNIFKNGKRVSFPQCFSLDEAKRIIDLSNENKMEQMLPAETKTYNLYDSESKHERETRKMEDHYLRESLWPDLIQ